MYVKKPILHKYMCRCVNLLVCYKIYTLVVKIYFYVLLFMYIFRLKKTMQIVVSSKVQTSM